MATKNDVKYLSLEGLRELITRLNTDNRLIKHATDRSKASGFYKVEIDANGHVKSATEVTLEDLTNLGVAASTDIKNSEITIKVNNQSDTFNLNQDSEKTLEFTISASDLGVDTALHFRGVVTPNEGETDEDAIARHFANPNPALANGDVCLIGNREYIYSDSNWHELGDAESHALKSVTISGDGTYITGGGTLADNRVLSHKTYGAAKAIGAYNIEIDTAGHISAAKELQIDNAGGHTHTASVTIPSYGNGLKPTTQTLGLAKTNGAKTSVVTKYETNTSKLVTTQITGVTGTQKYNTVVAQDAVENGNADVGDTVSGLAKLGASFVYGNASYVSTPTAVMDGFEEDDPAYSAKFEASSDDDQVGCLVLSPLTISIRNIHEATESTTSAYGCLETPAQVTGARKAANTIVPYTTQEVAIPVIAQAPTTVATGGLNASGTGSDVVTGLKTPSTVNAITTESSYGVTFSPADNTGVSVLTGVELEKSAATSVAVTVEAVADHAHNFKQ